MLPYTDTCTNAYTSVERVTGDNDTDLVAIHLQYTVLIFIILFMANVV